MERLDDAQQFGGIARFAEEIGCAPSAGLLYVLFVVGRTEDDDGHLFESGFLLQKIQDFEAVHARHLQVEQEEIRDGMGDSGHNEVIDRLLAILDMDKTMRERGFDESVLEEKRVVRIILGK